MEEDAAALARYLTAMEGARAAQTCDDILRTFAFRKDEGNLILWRAVARHLTRLLDDEHTAFLRDT